MIQRLALSSVLLAACSSSPAPSAEAPVEASAAATSSSATTAPAPPEAPKTARPAPPEGWERLAFAVEAGAKEALGVTLDVPAKWSIEGGRARGMSFESCANRSTVPFGTKIFVDARTCEDKEPVDACVARLLKVRMGEPTPKSDAAPGAKSRWVEGSKVNKNDIEQWQGAQIVYDEAHNAIVYCGYNMSIDPAPARAQYKQICSSLSLDPAASDKDLKPRDAAPEGAIGNAASIEHGEDFTKAALGFHAALVKGDVKAAEAFLSTTAVCAAAKPAEAARCKQGAKKEYAAFEKEFSRLAEAAPKTPPAGFWLMSADPKSKAPFFIAYPISADKPCEAVWDGGYPMVWIAGKATIAVATKAGEPKAVKKKKGG